MRWPCSRLCALLPSSPDPAAAPLQTTDIKVNSVTPALFAMAPTAEAMAAADVGAIAEIIKVLGLYANKSRHLKGMSQAGVLGCLECARPGRHAVQRAHSPA